MLVGLSSCPKLKVLLALLLGRHIQMLVLLGLRSSRLVLGKVHMVVSLEACTMAVVHAILLFNFLLASDCLATLPEVRDQLGTDVLVRDHRRVHVLSFKIFADTL